MQQSIETSHTTNQSFGYQSWWGAPGQRYSAARRRRLRAPVASYCDGSSPKKINLISCEPLAHVSDIKLIRTDTTLDLSQKAEKGMIDSGLLSFLLQCAPACALCYFCHMGRQNTDWACYFVICKTKSAELIMLLY